MVFSQRAAWRPHGPSPEETEPKRRALAWRCPPLARVVDVQVHLTRIRNLKVVRAEIVQTATAQFQVITDLAKGAVRILNDARNVRVHVAVVAGRFPFNGFINLCLDRITLPARLAVNTLKRL